jgi:hypothetical protein
VPDQEGREEHQEEAGADQEQRTRACLLIRSFPTRFRNLQSRLTSVI